MSDIYLPDGSLNVSSLLKNADLLLFSPRREDWSLAKQLLKPMLEGGIKLASVYEMLSLIAEKEGDLDRARKFIEDSIAYQPDLKRFLRLAHLLLTLGRFEPAAATFERVYRTPEWETISPSAREETLLAHLRCLKQAQRTQRMRHLAEDLLGQTHVSPSFRAQIVHLLSEVSEPEIALELLGTLSMEELSNALKAETFRRISALQDQCGNKEACHQALSRALALTPENPKDLKRLIELSYELKAFASAARAIEDYVEAAPFDANLLYVLAGLQFQLKRYRESGETARRLIELEKNKSQTSLTDRANDLIRRIDSAATENTSRRTEYGGRYGTT